MAPFRSGIGLLANNLNLPVVPVRLDGLFELRQRGARLARPGAVTVTIGSPVRFEPGTDPEQIARELEQRVADLKAYRGQL
jgi:long-chain acyl-CoA synthetase